MMEATKKSVGSKRNSDGVCKNKGEIAGSGLFWNSSDGWININTLKRLELVMPYMLRCED
jgi:hypothetical protein